MSKTPGRHKLILLLVIVALAISVYFGLHFFLKPAKRHSSTTAKPINVEFAKAKAALWQDSAETTGTVSAILGIMVRAEANGRITKVFIKSGQLVKTGQALYQVNPYPLQAQLKQDKANLQLTKFRLSESKKTFPQGATSQLEYNQRVTEYNAALATVERTAPIDRT